MKTGCFLFSIIGFGALTLGVSLAEQPSGQSSGQGLDENQTTSDRPADHMNGDQKSVSKKQAETVHPNLTMLYCIHRLSGHNLMCSKVDLLFLAFRCNGRINEED